MVSTSMNILPDAWIEGAALVVAHPDDEVLWFGSVVARVETLVVCFEDPGDARIALGRQRVAQAFPRPAHWLRIDEPGTWARTPWHDPTYTAHGLQAIDPPTDQRIADTFDAVLERLGVLLADATAIFTHNPWGEYGHADHALVHAAVRTLASTRAVPLLCPQIASLTSVRAMMRQPAAWGPPMSAEVDVGFCQRVRALYAEHGVWTWHDPWDVWTHDVFAQVLPGAGPVPGHALRWVRGFVDDTYPEHAEDRAIFATQSSCASEPAGPC